MTSSSLVQPVGLLRFLVALGVLNAYISIAFLWPQSSPDTRYTYEENDFPSVFAVPNIKSTVFLTTESTVHYRLNGSLADTEWAMLLPKPAAIVRLGPHFRPFAISMLHSLHCLDKLRVSIHEAPTTSIGVMHVNHCANYLREAILCAADTTLEPVMDGYMDMESLQAVTRGCRDWMAVYEEIQRNHEMFIKSTVDVPFA